MSKEEKIRENINDIKETYSRASKIKTLIKKNKGIFKDKESMVSFKEPVLMLMRRSRNVEIFEDASKGKFIFKHSDGKNREIYLEPSSQVSMDYARRKVRMYWCHEDFPLPLPENPLLTAETVNMIVEQSMIDTKRLDERNAEIRMKNVKMFLMMLFGIIGAIILWKFAPDILRFIGIGSKEVVNQATTTIQENITEIVSNRSLDILK